MTAAETGQLVLTSLHSQSAAAAVDRILESCAIGREGQIRAQLGETLKAIVIQRLIPRSQGGRLPAVEVLRVNTNVAALIRDGRVAQLASAIQSGGREGMITLERCLADLVRSRQVLVESAIAVANDPAALRQYLTE